MSGQIMTATPQSTMGILPEEVDLHTAEIRINKHKADWRGWEFMWPFAVVFVFVFIIPIVYAIYISFFKEQMVGDTKFVDFKNYARLVQDPQFQSSVSRITIFTVFQVPIMLFLAIAMTLASDSMKLHSTKFFRISISLPYTVPAVVSIMIWGFVCGAKYDLVDSLSDFLDTNIDVLSPGVLLASIANVNAQEHTGHSMLIFYSSLGTIPHSLHEATSIDGASKQQIVKKIKLPGLKGSLIITVIFPIIGSFQLFNELSILQNMVPGNAITTYYTPNMYAYGLSFTGSQSNCAVALAIVMAIITMAIVYVVQLKSMEEQMK